MHPKNKIGLGLLVALIGGSLADTFLTSGAISFGSGRDYILRDKAPIEFWLLVSCAIALAVGGSWLALVSVFRPSGSEASKDSNG
jgi:hypothetical protein